jgi:hypothetical protein
MDIEADVSVRTSSFTLLAIQYRSLQGELMPEEQDSFMNVDADDMVRQS